MIELKDFKFKQSLGQNFITDTNLLAAIVKDAGISEADRVLEIGAGAGTLTRELCATSAKVVAVEIDTRLEHILNARLSGFTNCRLWFTDILKVRPEEIAALFDSEPFKVVANLPYYISTPILFFLIESGLPIQSLTIMLQLELARRLTAKPSTKDYGALTVLLEFLGVVEVTRKVPRTLFVPVPKVDSAVVKITLCKDKFKVPFAPFSAFVKSCFAMRRKTLSNNLVQSGLARQEAEVGCKAAGIDPQARAETLSCMQFVELFKSFSGKIDKKQ